jgi:hypothetical protein
VLTLQQWRWDKLEASINHRTGNDNTKFEYFVDGVVEWKLLATRYSQQKNIKASH